MSKYKEAKDKIIGRGVGKGYYLANRIYRSTLHESDYWTNWGELTYIRLKDGGHILKKEGDAFEIQFAKGTAEYAPWFGKTLLLQGAWENRVQCGCVNCNRVPNWGERNELRWFDEGTFFCPDCLQLELVKDLIAEYDNQQKSA